MKKLLSKVNLSLQLLLTLAIALLLGHYLSPSVKGFFLSISLSLKEMLLFCLPLIIIPCLVHSLVAYQGPALRFVCILLLAVSFFNILGIFTAFGIGTMALSSGMIQPEQSTSALVLEPLWLLGLPQLLSPKTCLVLGLSLGLFLSFVPMPRVIRSINTLHHRVTLFLQKLFIPILPIFIFGFILQMEHEGILSRVIGNYGPIVLLVVLANIAYLSLFFLVAAKCNPSVCWTYIKNVFPASLLAFTTMSSLVTLPLTLRAAEKNTHNPDLAQAIIPATVNIHMVGELLAIPIIAMGILLAFGHPLPSVTQYFLFAQYFFLIRFCVPAIPLGSIIIILPLLETYFGFTTQMSSCLAASYIIFEPIVTPSNVLGNSALAILLVRFLEPKERKHQNSVSSMRTFAENSLDQLQNQIQFREGSKS